MKNGLIAARIKGEQLITAFLSILRQTVLRKWKSFKTLDTNSRITQYV